jgi:hypothetical protein
MKVLYAIILYMVISGALLGLVQNYRLDRCGEPVKISDSDIFASLLFPLAFGLVLTANDEALADAECDR